ncbi:guanine nucleotide binding protein (G protein) alpha v1 isoform X2 [Betta splendens]|uniref:Guanine nucleotide binding protein (G protein) alpha v1 isoform X2 n=1 Tax=Betta splendens TaxID=158456 RepID=A0A9W2XQ87_BETSP|nr:guanine nucleotide binding protein (G protein) alpha v1 isoform X2 [Betta splendens]
MSAQHGTVPRYRSYRGGEEGAAESGKSTLVKQMKIIHSHGFNKQELISFKPAVLDNLLTSMKFVLHGMGVLRINLLNSRNKVHAHSVLSCGRCFDEDQVLFPFLSHALHCLWADTGVRAAAARGYEYELNDSALYFFQNMTRITSPGYVPTETDVLRVRLRTTGVIETQFKVNHLIFRMYDVGGQRTERRKWIGCFEDVRAVLFVVSLSGYDMTLVEDPSTNRLQESMNLFSSVCNNVFFRSTSMILFMNKIDLFQEKILHSGRHLRLYLRQFKGADCDVDSAARFVVDAFVSLNAAPDRLVYYHFTTATDTGSVQVVFQVVMDTIIRENLEAVSLL